MSRYLACWICLAIVVMGGGVQGSFAYGQPPQESRGKIAELEQKLATLEDGVFDWRLHNQLRHMYSTVDQAKSMGHCDIIFQHSPMDGYVLQTLGGKDPDKRKAIAAMTDLATKFAHLPHLAAACWLRAGDLESDRERAATYYKKALAIRGVSTRYRELAEDRILFAPNSKRRWPEPIPAPQGMQSRPGPWNDPKDETSWPNQTSRANSDPWLAKNHERIKSMRPRLLLINFSNEHTNAQIGTLTRRLIRALADGSRYHGYSDEQTPAFLKYQPFHYVDLRDRDRKKGDSRKVPVKDPAAKSGFNMKYRQYFSEEFAQYYGIRDPRDPERFLRLDELVDGGYVHEVWFFLSGATDVAPHSGAYEVVEMKPRYDKHFQKVGNEYVQAGNGGDREQPWTGRSVRIGFVNASRGIGCFIESLSHGIEGMSNSGAIPYFTQYFREYAGFDLAERFDVPFSSLYAVEYNRKQIRYPDAKTMIVTHRGKEHQFENYVCAGGSAHFPPNARAHYDLANDQPVLSTIEDWRIGGGPDGKDRAKPFTNAAFRRYESQTPDCMGPWLIYWRQNMPGLNNHQKDNDGKPMKNWWPFLFY